MIGIFDSGIGGLTVVRELMRQAPDASFLYLGDTARTPYGNKTAETVQRYAIEDARFLIERGATSIIIACNTASALAEDVLKKEFPLIPVFGVIRPAIAAALGSNPKTLGVIGTRATVGSGIYPRLLRAAGAGDVPVMQVACPLFTTLAEEGFTDNQVAKLVARKYLSGFRAHTVDSLILGCTHYPILRDVIRHAVSRRTQLIDPAEETVSFILKNLSEIDRSGKKEFFLSDVAPHTVAVANTWLRGSFVFESAIIKSCF